MSIVDKIRERKATMVQQQRAMAIKALWSGDEDAAMNSGLSHDELMQLAQPIGEAKGVLGELAQGDLDGTRKRLKKAIAARDTHQAKMDALVAKMEQEQRSLDYEADDERRLVSALEDKVRTLVTLHTNNASDVIPLGRLPECVHEMLRANGASAARQQADAKRIQAWNNMKGIERKITALRAQRNEVAHIITERGHEDLGPYDEAEAQLLQELESAKREHALAESDFAAAEEKCRRN